MITPKQDNEFRAGLLFIKTTAVIIIGLSWCKYVMDGELRRPVVIGGCASYYILIVSTVIGWMWNKRRKQQR